MNGFTALVQLLATIGVGVGILGAILAVSASSQGRSARGGVLLSAVGFIVGVVFFLVSNGLLIVSPTERAVIFNVATGQLESPRSSGVSIIFPGVQQPFIYPISQQTITFSTGEAGNSAVNSAAIQARSIDGQQVEVDLTLIFRLDANENRINQIHLDWSSQPGGYVEGLVLPAVRSIVRDVVSKLEAENIYGAGREQMQLDITSRLTTSLERSGITVSEVLVRNVNFTEQFTDAIERKQIEQQELQRAQTEARRLEEEAKGRANANIEEARGQAEATLLRAEAEAKALELVSEQIAKNPSLIQYNYVQNLSDNVQLILVPSNSPFLFDPTSLLQPTVPTAPASGDN